LGTYHCGDLVPLAQQQQQFPICNCCLKTRILV